MSKSPKRIAQATEALNVKKAKLLEQIEELAKVEKQQKADLRSSAREWETLGSYQLGSALLDIAIKGRDVEYIAQAARHITAKGVEKRHDELMILALSPNWWKRLGCVSAEGGSDAAKDANDETAVGERSSENSGSGKVEGDDATIRRAADVMEEIDKSTPEPATEDGHGANAAGRPNDQHASTDMHEYGSELPDDIG